MGIQEDKKIIIGGRIGSVNGIDKTNIARLYENGELDLNFKTAIRDNVMTLSTNF